MTATLQIAERQARQAHAGQREELTGDDYIHHVERVVALVDGGTALAFAVKISDLRDHLRPMNPEVLTASMRQKYEGALRTLEGSAR